MDSNRKTFKSYRITSPLYLEWFGDEALVLVAGRDLLLTLNRAAGTLAELLLEVFPGRDFTLDAGTAWLDENYDLGDVACQKQARVLLAFALKHHLVAPAPAGECG